MTPPNEPAPNEPHGSPSEATVLAEGRLDPRSIVLRVLERIGQLWLLILIVALRNPSEATFYLVFGIFTIVTSLLEYSRFRYRLTSDALEITAGIFTRRERRIPLDRIHDVSQAQSVLRRVLGVVTVNVETASSAGAEAKLDALAPDQARELREALGRVTRRAEQAEVPVDETVLHESTVGELLLLGFTDNRAGVIVLGFLLVLQELFEVAEERTAKASVLLGQYLRERVADHGTMTVFVVVIAAGLLLIVAGWFVSAILTWAKFGGFRLTERDGVFRRTYGVLTTREQSMPRRYLQILRLEESPLRRLARLVVVRGENAGSSLDPKNAQKSGVDVFVPAMRRAAARALVPRVLTGANPEPGYARTSRKLVSRWGTRGALLAAMVGITGAFLRPHVGWAALAAFPFFTTLAGWLAHRKLGWTFDDDRLAVRWGILGRYRAWMPRDRAQAVEVRATPFDRFAGVVHLRVVVTGGGHLRIGYLTPDDAERVMTFLAVDNPAPLRRDNGLHESGDLRSRLAVPAP